MEWADRLRRLAGWEVEVGYPADETPSDFVDIVRINFLGSADGEHPPARPLLDEALARVDATGAREELVRAALAGADPARALGAIGEKVEAEAREILATGSGLVDNAPATVALKGANAPLRTPGAGPTGNRFERYLTHRVLRRSAEGA